METVAHHAARRTAAARAHRDAHAPGVADKIGDDEEIVGKAHLLDHVLFVLQLGPAGRIVPVPLPVAVVTELFQIREAVVPLRQLEFRQVVLAEGEFQVAHLRDLPGVLHRPLEGGKESLHLLRAAQVEVPGLVAHPVLIVQRLAGLDAKEHVVGLRVLLAQVVGVVGADHGDARLLVDAQNPTVHLHLVRDAVVLEFQVEPVRPEEVRHLQGVGLGVFILPVTETPGNLPRQARREGDESSAVLPQQRLIDAGLDVKALRPGGRHQVGEIPVPLLIFAQQHQVAALGIELVDLVEPGTALGRHINLAADDGLDALRLAGPVEVDNAVHDAVVRDGAGGLPHGLHHAGQILDAAGAVQKAVFRMDV